MPFMPARIISPRRLTGFANPLQLSGIQAKPRRLVRDRPFGQSVLASLEEVTVGKWMVHLAGSSLEKVNG